LVEQLISPNLNTISFVHVRAFTSVLFMFAVLLQYHLVGQIKVKLYSSSAIWCDTNYTCICLLLSKNWI